MTFFFEKRLFILFPLLWTHAPHPRVDVVSFWGAQHLVFMCVSKVLSVVSHAGCYFLFSLELIGLFSFLIYFAMYCYWFNSRRFVIVCVFLLRFWEASGPLLGHRGRRAPRAFGPCASSLSTAAPPPPPLAWSCPSQIDHHNKSVTIYSYKKFFVWYLSFLFPLFHWKENKLNPENHIKACFISVSFACLITDFSDLGLGLG